MQLEVFIRTHKRDWEQLEALLRRVDKDQVAGLSQQELIEFGRLYRSATSDLAIAQRDFPTKDVAAYLNQLVGRAHPIVYRGEPLAWRRLRAFYRVGLPQLYREVLPYTLFAALLMFGPAVLVYFIMLWNPAGASYLLDPFTIAEVKSGSQWWKDLNDMNALGASLIMTNNLRVAFFAFAGGITFGLLTVYVLIVNGLHLGAILGLMRAYGTDLPLWEFVVGHGVIELTVITIAGGSGLMLGDALVRPGLLSRADALALAAGKAMRLILGIAPMLVIAGLIEGLLSPRDDIPWFVKVGVGVGTGILLYGYLLFAGRNKVRAT